MTDFPMGPPMAPQAVPGEPRAGDEILVAFAGPARQNRLTVLVRIVLAIPHLIVLYALGIAAEVVALISWFAALFIGRLPSGLADFLSGYLRWTSRVYAYLLLLTDEYPPFELGDSDYPLHVAMRPGRLNRLAVLFRLVLAIPAYLVIVALAFGLGSIAILIVWLIVLVSGTMPESLYGAIAAVLRYHARFFGYMLLLSGTYPKGLFGDEPGPAGGPGLSQWPGTPAPGYGQPGYGQPGMGSRGMGRQRRRSPGMASRGSHRSRGMGRQRKRSRAMANRRSRSRGMASRGSRSRRWPERQPGYGPPPQPPRPGYGPPPQPGYGVPAQPPPGYGDQGYQEPGMASQRRRSQGMARRRRASRAMARGLIRSRPTGRPPGGR